VDSELEGQEEHRDIDWLVLSHLYLLELAGVGLRNCWRLALGQLGVVLWLILLRLSTASLLGVALASLLLLLVLLVDDLDLENDVLREWVVQVDVNLAGFVELGGLVDGVDRVSLVDIGDELEHHGCSLHVTLFLVRKDDLACHLLRDPALELDWEVELLAWLDSHRLRFYREVGTAVKLDPVADWVLGGVAQLDILGNHVTKNCWELDIGLGNVVRETLIELDAEEKKLSGTWLSDVVWSEMGLQSNLVHGIDDALGV
jgi:hypothetical protein